MSFTECLGWLIPINGWLKPKISDLFYYHPPFFEISHQKNRHMKVCNINYPEPVFPPKWGFFFIICQICFFEGFTLWKLYFLLRLP